MPCAVITGISGQDGSYLAELLLNKGYVVLGMVRRSSHMTNLDRLKDIRTNKNLHIVYGDVTDMSSVMSLLNTAKQYLGGDDCPLEIYNLAAQSHVKISFQTPIYTTHVDALGTLNILEAIVQLDMVKKTRFYQASTSELYGLTPGPQNEESPMQPQSPYAIAKLYSYWLVKSYRTGHDLFAVNGILFNHESERRAENFVTRKITMHVSKVYKGSTEVLKLGNLYASRDWGHAKDYVEAMWLMLQQENPEDFVIATGATYTIKEFVEAAFKYIGKTIAWKGDCLEERGYDCENGDLLIAVDPIYFRPAEVHHLQGDASKAYKLLNWKPTITFNDLVKGMVENDIEALKTSV